MKKNIWLDGMMGLVAGDALGVPVQFMRRSEIRNRAKGIVTGMESGGVFNVPQGTWTDDSSMALATLVSIIYNKGVDPVDIMTRFVEWYYEGAYTPFGKAFDQGITCSNAISVYAKRKDIKTCGKTGEHANGNGALMRILPLCLYYIDRQKTICTADDEAIENIHVVGSLTHNHLRSNMCCGMYYFMAKSIVGALNKHALDMDGMNGNKMPDGGVDCAGDKPALMDLLQAGMDQGLDYYGRDLRNLEEKSHLSRLFDLAEFKELPEQRIKSSGYVVDTLEAAVWCLLTTDSLEACLLKAVNLGDDADTVAAVAGGLAGLYYGYDAIPKAWLDVIKKRAWIEEVCEEINQF